MTEPIDKPTIKFRVWDTRGRIMIYPSPHMNPLYLTLGGRLVEIDREGNEVPAPNYVLLQSTGLTDRNGKDIYEGDILKHYKYGGVHVVKWIVESTGFFVGEEAWPLSALCRPNIAVIGNIYEPADKHRQEARELSRAMTLEGVCWRRKNFWANEGQTTRDFDFLLSLLSSRDAEIREVLEGLRSGGCWCELPPNITSPDHTCECDAAKGLWERVQG